MNPLVLLLTLIASLMFIELEFLRPGRVVFGVTGAVGLVFCASRLLTLGISPYSEALFCVSWLVICLGWMTTWNLLLSSIGAVGIVLSTIAISPSLPLYGHLSIAAALLATTLPPLQIAAIARRNKRRI